MTKDTQTHVAPSLGALKSRNPAIFAERGTDVEILDACSGEPTGAVFTVFGRDSAAYKSEVRAMQLERLEHLAKNPGERGQPLTPEQSAQGEARLLRASLKCTNIPDFPTDAASVEQFFLDDPWIGEQLEKAITDRAVFMKPR